MQIVLTHQQIKQKLTRMAHEVLEQCYGINELYIGGIQGNGEIFAKQLKEIIEQSSSIQVKFFSISLDKENPLSTGIELSIDNKELAGKNIILFDDVINSGITMQYGLLKILDVPVRSVKTVALVERMHRRFPIKCDIVGMTLTTTIQERVEVLEKDGVLEAFLV